VAGTGDRGRGLDQQGRFADAGIAADEEHRAAHEAAAGDAVEFRDAGWGARCIVGLAGERMQHERRPLRGGLPRTGRLRRLPLLSSAMVFHSPHDSHLPCQRP